MRQKINNIFRKYGEVEVDTSDLIYIYELILSKLEKENVYKSKTS